MCKLSLNSDFSLPKRSSKHAISGNSYLGRFRSGALSSRVQPKIDKKEILLISWADNCNWIWKTYIRIIKGINAFLFFLQSLLYSAIMELKDSLSMADSVCISDQAWINSGFSSVDRSGHKLSTLVQITRPRWRAITNKQTNKQTNICAVHYGIFLLKLPRGAHFISQDW